nr:DUF4974 domain-containing protein [Cytophagales bacterium]
MKEQQDYLMFLLANPEFVRWVKHPDKRLDIYWNNWIEGHPEATKDIMKAKAIVLAFKEQKVVPLPGKKEVLLQKIVTSDRYLARRTQMSKPNSLSQWDRTSQWNKVAAILFAVLVCSGLYQFATYTPVTKVNADTPPPVWITKTTSPGEKLMVKLPDGSTIWLNSASQLRFPESFDSLLREVEVAGEAYFEVIPDPNRPMRVCSGELTTHVLGTSFTITTEDELRQRVSLISGKVRIESRLSDKDVMLNAGEQLTYNQRTGMHQVSRFEAAEVLAWKEGILLFRDATFGDVVSALERWYGVQMQVKGSPSREWKLSGSFKNQDLDLVLQRMAYMESFDYTINHKKVSLQFNTQEP